MEKPKRKSKQKQAFLHRIIFGKQFSFYSPYAIEECKELLIACPRYKNFAFASIEVILKNIEPSRCDFCIQKRPFRNIKSEVLGTLVQDGSMTHIIGRARISLSTISSLIPFLLFPWCLLSLGANENHMRSGALMSVAVVTILLFLAVIERGRITKLLYEVLGKQS
jgi:hypothetical protein